MTTTRLRWPTAAETEREEAQLSAEEAVRLLDEANKLLRYALNQANIQSGAAANIATALAPQSQALALQWQRPSRQRNRGHIQMACHSWWSARPSRFL